MIEFGVYLKLMPSLDFLYRLCYTTIKDVGIYFWDTVWVIMNNIFKELIDNIDFESTIQLSSFPDIVDTMELLKTDSRSKRFLTIDSMQRNTMTNVLHLTINVCDSSSYLNTSFFWERTDYFQLVFRGDCNGFRMSGLSRTITKLEFGANSEEVLYLQRIIQMLDL